jgi:UDP-glucose 4-epimerase
MTIAWVVGAGGMLGSALCRSLSRAQIRVFVPEDRFDWENETRLSGQLQTAIGSFAARVLSGERWEIHWAAGLGTMASSQASMARETRLLERLLAVAGEQPALMHTQGTVVLASSAGAIYAGSSAEEITEATAIAPTTEYARAKLQQEQRVTELVAAHPATRAVIGRISTLYGARTRIEKRQGLIAEMARRVTLNQPIHIYVPLDTIRDYLAVEDAADALVALSQRPAGGSRVLMKIIASEQATTISEITATFKKIAHRMPRIVTSSNNLTDVYRRRIQFHSIVAPDAASQPKTTLTVGISRVLAAERLAFARYGSHETSKQVPWTLPQAQTHSRVAKPLQAFALTDPDGRISRIRLFQAGNPVRPGANHPGG